MSNILSFAATLQFPNWCRLLVVVSSVPSSQSVDIHKSQAVHNSTVHIDTGTDNRAVELEEEAEADIHIQARIDIAEDNHTQADIRRTAGNPNSEDMRQLVVDRKSHSVAPEAKNDSNPQLTSVY